MNPNVKINSMACVGMAESIAAKLLEMANGSRWTAGEYADLYFTLRDIEDRLYQKGEYAPENVADLRGGAR